MFRLRPAVWTIFRFRPGSEKDRGSEFLKSELSDRSKSRFSLILRAHHLDKRQTGDVKYTFDRGFREKDTNKTVYEQIEPLIDAALKGLDVVIFLDGPSGSGKTYTLLKPSSVIACSIVKQIFQPSCFEEGRPHVLEVKLFGFKDYMDKLYDAKDRNRTEKSVKEGIRK